MKRIEDIRTLRERQFPEDNGPMAHPVRPDSYAEIDNFYTLTVYEKGAEIVRMYQTMFGKAGFRKGMDLYFSRHDGQAVTCDDFLKAMADANDADLSQFALWYSQEGTPRVEVKTAFDPKTKCYTLTFRQKSTREGQKLFHIPMNIALLDPLWGNPLDLRLESENGQAKLNKEKILHLTQEEHTFVFSHLQCKPVPSLLRGFSAPVIVEYDYTIEELAFLMQNDTDLFNRWDAAQQLIKKQLITLVESIQKHQTLDVWPVLTQAFASVLEAPELSPAFKVQLLTLPAESWIAEQFTVMDPIAIHQAMLYLRQKLAEELQTLWESTYEAHVSASPMDLYSPDPVDASKRALKNLCLSYLGVLKLDSIAELAQQQYEQSNNMTDRLAALSTLIFSYPKQASVVLQDFYERFGHEPLVIDKWLRLQAIQPKAAEGSVLENITLLMRHPAFNFSTPNHISALIVPFCNANPVNFHQLSGEGYQFWAKQVLALDAINPHVAARLARTMEHWRRYIPALKAKMQEAIQHVAASPHLSSETREIIDCTQG